MSDMSAVLSILRSLYRHIQTLEEFADSIVFKEGKRATLVEQADSSRFKSFVGGVFVCCDKQLQQVPKCCQVCTLPELLAYVLNSMKRKKKRNVLAHGYNFMAVAQEDRDADHFKFQGEITQSAAYIHGSDLWKKISLRLGSDIMQYLLESCSMFVAVPPSCVFQVCGIPLYDRVSMTAASSAFCLQPKFGKRICSIRHQNFKKKMGASDTGALRKTMADGGVKIGKRKRELDQLEEESVTCSGKRRRLTAHPEGKRETEQAEENTATTSKQSVEVQNTKFPFEGGQSLRLSDFPALPPSHCFIRTLGFMYGGKGMRTFLLNRKKKGASGSGRLQGKDLIREIFFEGVTVLNGLERKQKRLPKRFFNMVPLFNQLLKQHRRWPYERTLQKMCPLLRDGNLAQEEMGSLLQRHCAPHRVFLFVRECLSAVIPPELWGSEHNRLHFLAKVRGFLQSGKFERLSLAELMWNMKVNDCDWLKISKTGEIIIEGRFPPSELAYRTRILGQFLTWLLDRCVVGLIRACFYATESVGQKNALRFYRQEIWAKLQDLAFKVHLGKGQMEEMSPAQVASLPKGTVVSRLRFIPKTDGMRPITRVNGTDSRKRLYQSGVRDLLDILRACVGSNPSLLGSTVWGMTDIHKRLSSLAPAQKHEPQQLFFVKADVSGAYESLPHDKLAEVISYALSPVQNKLFTIRRYAKIWANSHEGLKRAFIRQADLLDNDMGFTNMKGFLMSLQKSNKVHHSILVEQHFSSEFCGADALQFFTKMLTSSLVQFGKKTYNQCHGIPQGSVVSSLLCCLCYGHMENALFKDIVGSRGCLMRLVDDFLLITPDQHQAQTFLKTLLAGVPQYGLVVNPQKVAVNFQVLGDQDSSPGLRLLPPRSLFPWCGLLLDTHSLDVYKDYSSYAGLSLRYSLTLGSFHSAGQQMKRKLMAILRLKCHALFVDLKINSYEVVYKNIYKLVLLHACRFHVCAQSLPFGQTVSKNPAYFQQMIWEMALYANKLIRSSNKGLVLGNKFLTGPLQFEAVELIFCLSFLLVLSQHRAVYKDLITHLHKRKRRLEQSLGHLRLARVRQASNPRTPLDFLGIKKWTKI